MEALKYNGWELEPALEAYFNHGAHAALAALARPTRVSVPCGAACRSLFLNHLLWPFDRLVLCLDLCLDLCTKRLYATKHPLSDLRI